MRRIEVRSAAGFTPGDISAYRYLVDKFDIQLVDRYLDFLLAVQTTGRTDVPELTPAVDQVWHAHILCTEKYAADCNKLFWGQFLHHDPELYAVRPKPQPVALRPGYHLVHAHRRSNGSRVRAHTRKNPPQRIVCG